MIIIILIIILFIVLVARIFLSNREYHGKQRDLQRNINTKYLYDDAAMLNHYVSHLQNKYSSHYKKNKQSVKGNKKKHKVLKDNINRDNIHLTVIKGGKKVKK